MNRSMAPVDFAEQTCADKFVILNCEKWYRLQISTVMMKKGIDPQLWLFSRFETSSGNVRVPIHKEVVGPTQMDGCMERSISIDR